VVAVGAGVTKWKTGDRVMSFHHVPCGSCFYCERRLFSQCPAYKKVGLTAGFDPNGGGFAQYVRAMPWVAERGMVAIPDDVTFDEASFIEPVNTCIKAVEKARVAAGETAVVMGLGPIGLLLAMLAKLEDATVIGSDPMAERRAKSISLGLDLALDPREGRLAEEIRSRTAGRGADAVLVAVPIPAALTDALNLVRPGGRVLLFAQNDPLMKIEFPAAAVGVEEKEILGSYSAAIDRADRAAKLIFTHQLPVGRLISHRFSLEDMNKALQLAARPVGDSLKVVIHP
jgi:L-iditol 2-dehydrogenase